MVRQIAITLLVISCVAVNAAGQIRQAEFEVHDRANLWETMKDDGTIGAPNPTNRVEFFPSMDWPGGPHVLPEKDDQRSYNVGAGMWIGGRRADNNLFFTENGPFNFVDQGTFEKIERRDNFVEEAGYDPAQPEQTIVARWTTSENIRVQRTSKVWSFRGLNNFVILEYEISNRRSEAVHDVFIGFPYLLRPSYQDFVVHNGWGDDFNRADDLVAYDEARRLVYAWDDTPNFSLPWDVGNFWEEAGELRTTGYAGIALMEASPASNAEPQPANVLWAQLLNNEHRLSIGRTGIEQMYALLSGADRSLQASSDERLAPFILLSVGPYAIPASGSVRVVLVQAVGGLPIDQALKGLAAQSLLPAGRDSLRNTIDRAIALHGRNYQIANVPPPAPDVQLLALPSSRSISLAWDPLETTWAAPGTGTAITEYRIYRSDRSFVGPFRQIRRIRVTNSVDLSRFFDNSRGKWSYIDNDVSLGAGYFYGVTSIDAAGKESWMTNLNETPLTVTGSPADDALNVRVFPNPFRQVSGFPTRGEENSIVWTNLPARATVQVYTSSGELFKTIEHDDPDSGQAVWDQLSDARQRTAPGIYFWTVQSAVGTAQGTLVIIK